MRKLKILTLALLCALIALVFAGCFGGGDPKLELYTSPAVYYAVGDQINLDNAMIKYGESYVTITNSMISNFSTTIAGEKEMTLSYEGKSITISYIVFENVLNDVWYISEHNEIYTYVKFNLSNKRITGFTCNIPNINDVDIDEQTTFTYEYTQNINSSGIKFSTTDFNVKENITETMTITNITANSFTFRTTTYYDYNGAIFFDETMSFTKCN